MTEEIRPLIRLITEAAATLDRTCYANGTRVPGIAEPFHSESEAFRDDLAAAEAANIIGTAALQLAAVTVPPHLLLFTMIGGQWNSAALRVCLESNVTEILREAGADGMHVDDIASKNGVDAQKLSRCLRLLTTHHVYREVKPNVFANTRASSLLDTMKPSKTVIQNPEHKHENTDGFPALASFLLDEFFKSSAYLWESISDPKIAKSGEPTDTAMAMAVSNGLSMYDYYNQPGEEVRRRRFDIGMRGVHSMLSTGIALEAYDWKSLPNNALIVDVGGGVGSISMALAQEYKNIKFVIQDRPNVVENGIQVWEQNMPRALASGRIKFEVHDFFGPQPQTDASIFILKHIVHNWSDEYSLKILKQLRNAATPETKIICLETILPYSCRDPNAKRGIPGVETNEAPEPLLPNWGLAGGMSFYMDLSMMTNLNALARTIDQFEVLFKNAGWKINAIRRPSVKNAHQLAAIEAIPI